LSPVDKSTGCKRDFGLALFTTRRAPRSRSFALDSVETFALFTTRRFCRHNDAERCEMRTQ